MPLFADMSNESIALIVGAVLVAFKFFEKVYDNRRLDAAASALAKKVEKVRVDALAAASTVADKVTDVKETVATTAQKADAGRDEIKAAVERSSEAKTARLEAQDKVLAVIASQTNGLMARIEEAGFQAGVKSETDKK